MVNETGSGSMHIQLNGDPRELASTLTIADLLRELGIRSDRVAVEVNLEIVDRQAFDRTSVQEGDRIEIIRFIGGGEDKEWSGRLLCSRNARDRNVLVVRAQ